MDDRALRRNLVELLQGGHAHADSRRAFAGLHARRRTVRPSGAEHSVYELLAHMAIAQRDILRYTRDAGWQSPPWPDGYWPTDNDGLTPQTWARTLADFGADLDEVVALVRDPALDLTAKIPHGEGRTYLRQVLLVADHNAYHLGQVVQTRKLLGAWGP